MRKLKVALIHVRVACPSNAICYPVSLGSREAGGGWDDAASVMKERKLTQFRCPYDSYVLFISLSIWVLINSLSKPDGFVMGRAHVNPSEGGHSPTFMEKDQLTPGMSV